MKNLESRTIIYKWNFTYEVELCKTACGRSKNVWLLTISCSLTYEN